VIESPSAATTIEEDDEEEPPCAQPATSSSAQDRSEARVTAIIRRSAEFGSRREGAQLGRKPMERVCGPMH
jgi:hypothetical protein